MLIYGHLIQLVKSYYVPVNNMGQSESGICQRFHPMFMPGEAALLGITSPSDASKRRRALVLQSLAEAAAFRCRGETRTKATWRF